MLLKGGFATPSTPPLDPPLGAQGPEERSSSRAFSFPCERQPTYAQNDEVMYFTR